MVDVWAEVFATVLGGMGYQCAAQGEDTVIIKSGDETVGYIRLSEKGNNVTAKVTFEGVDTFKMDLPDLTDPNNDPSTVANILNMSMNARMGGAFGGENRFGSGNFFGGVDQS